MIVSWVAKKQQLNSQMLFCQHPYIFESNVLFTRLFLNQDNQSLKPQPTFTVSWNSSCFGSKGVYIGVVVVAPSTENGWPNRFRTESNFHGYVDHFGIVVCVYSSAHNHGSVENGVQRKMCCLSPNLRLFSISMIMRGRVIIRRCWLFSVNLDVILGGGFKYFLFSPLPGDMI